MSRFKCIHCGQDVSRHRLTECLFAQRDALSTEVEELKSKIKAMQEDRDAAYIRDRSAWEFLVERWKEYAGRLKQAGDPTRHYLNGVHLPLTQLRADWAEVLRTEP